jgi:hypothetical protein
VGGVVTLKLLLLHASRQAISISLYLGRNR